MVLRRSWTLCLSRGTPGAGTFRWAGTTAQKLNWDHGSSSWTARKVPVKVSGKLQKRTRTNPLQKMQRDFLHPQLPLLIRIQSRYNTCWTLEVQLSSPLNWRPLTLLSPSHCNYEAECWSSNTFELKNKKVCSNMSHKIASGIHWTLQMAEMYLSIKVWIFPWWDSKCWICRSCLNIPRYTPIPPPSSFPWVC